MDTDELRWHRQRARDSADQHEKRLAEVEAADIHLAPRARGLTLELIRGLRRYADDLEEAVK
jgi:hypothetical protein